MPRQPDFHRDFYGAVWDGLREPDTAHPHEIDATRGGDHR